MPAFDVEWTRGVEVLPFEDPGGVLPGRLNPRQNHPPLHCVARPGAYVQFSVVVGDEVAPTDADVGGQLHARIIESPCTPPPRLFSPCGRSSRAGFHARSPGHYTIVVVGNNSGGAKGRVVLHLSVEP